MQDHLDNYHEINEKLRQQIISLENRLKSQPKNQIHYERKHSEEDVESVKKRGR